METLRSWLLEHADNPFPSKADKKQLAKVTGLHFDQVSQWFVNVRMRVWRKLLPKEALEAPSAPTTKKRKARSKIGQPRKKRSIAHSLIDEEPQLLPSQLLPSWPTSSPVSQQYLKEGAQEFFPLHDWLTSA